MARVTSLEQNAASGSSSPDSARSWNMPGQSNGSTATGSLGSHGPGSSDDNRNTRRRVDTFSIPEDERARSAVLLRFPCELTTQVLRSGSTIFGKNPTCHQTANLSEFIAKQVLCRPDSNSKQEPNVRTLWPDIKTMASLTKLTVPSASPKQLSRCFNPNRLKLGDWKTICAFVERIG